MTAHEQYVIRLPEALWERMLKSTHFSDGLSPTSLAALKEAVRGCLGGGHARYVVGTPQTLGRILFQLRALTNPNLNEARRELAYGKANFDRLGHQPIKPRGEVRINERCDDKHHLPTSLRPPLPPGQ